MRVFIDDLNHDGRGRGTVNGRTALVSQALPGEVLDIIPDRMSKTLVQGRPLHWENRSSEHMHPCPHEARCTGCPLLRAPIALEDAFKQNTIADILTSVDPRIRPEPLVRPSELFSYRHYCKQVASLGSNGELVLGSYIAGTHNVADNGGCPILAPKLVDVIETVRSRLQGIDVHGATPGLRYVVARLSRSSGEALVVCVTSGPVAELASRLHSLPHAVFAVQNEGSGNVLLDGRVTHLSGPRQIVERMLGYDHAIGPTSFFQINPVAAHFMFESVLEAAGRGVHCVEGYCGVGVLTLPLLERFDRVSANEIHASSIQVLTDNAHRIGRLERLEARSGPAEGALVEMLSQNPDVVVLDPPRKGLGQEVASAVRQSGAHRVVLLSCDPKSLAGDLPSLLKSYRVASVKIIDQFPRTAHAETLTVLDREL